MCMNTLESSKKKIEHTQRRKEDVFRRTDNTYSQWKKDKNRTNNGRLHATLHMFSPTGHLLDLSIRSTAGVL